MRADTLDKRRRRGDLMYKHTCTNIMYKLMTNKETIPFSRFFLLVNRSGLRGHRYKIFRKSEGAIKQRFFSSRAIEELSPIVLKRAKSQFCNIEIMLFIALMHCEKSTSQFLILACRYVDRIIPS